MHGARPCTPSSPQRGLVSAPHRREVDIVQNAMKTYQPMKVAKIGKVTEVVQEVGKISCEPGTINLIGADARS